MSVYIGYSPFSDYTQCIHYTFALSQPNYLVSSPDIAERPRCRVH